MKKKRAKFVALCMAGAMVLGCFATAQDAFARRETKTISDAFDDSAYVGKIDTDVWTGYAATEKGVRVVELVKPQKVLTGQAKNITGETNLLMSKDWYWEIHSFSFDMYIPTGTNWENSKWAFLDFVDIEEPVEYAGDFGEYGEPMCYDAMKVLGADDFGLQSTTWKDWGFNSDTIGGTWISVKVITENATTGKIMIAPKGQAFDETKAQGLMLGGHKSFYNSNIVLGDFKFAGYMFDNFVIETDTGTYKEDFEDGTNDLFEEISIRETENPSYPIVEYGGSRKLAFKNTTAEDRIVTNKKITQEDEYLKAADKVLDVSFDVDYKNNNTAEEIACVFGLSSNDASPFSDSCAVVIGKNNIRLSYFDTEGAETVYATKKLGTNLRGSTISLALTKKGEFTASVNGAKVLSYSGIENCEGHIALAAKTNISKAVYVDDVVINNTYFDIITTKSIADDFSENKMGSGTDSDYAWYVEGGSMQIENGELAFRGCSDNTYFGPAYEYETYELSFRMTSLYTTDNEDEKMDATYWGRWIGLDFGKGASTIKTYGTYCLFSVLLTPTESRSSWKEAGCFTYKVDSSEAEELMTKVKPIPKEYFEAISYDGKTKTREDISEDDAVCFKFVALKDKVELYLKRASEKKYIKYATVENVDPKGYVSLACTGFSFWTLDNFKIKNTTEIYDEAPPVVIEEKVFPTLEERGVGVQGDHWKREQMLNERNAGISPIVWIAGGSGIALIGIASFTVHQLKKKKKAKNSETN